MNQLQLTTQDGEVRADSRELAKGFEISHKAIFQLINQKRLHLEQFGQVPFQMEAVKTVGGRGIKKIKFALLNKLQSALLATFCRNTPSIEQFKVGLILKMDQMEKALMSGLSYLSPAERWLIATMRRMPRALDALDRVMPTNNYSDDKGLCRGSYKTNSRRRSDAGLVHQVVLNFFPQIGEAK